MRLPRGNAFAALVVAFTSFAEEPQDPASKLRDELLAMAEEDQRARRALMGATHSDPALIETMKAVDAKNTARMKEILRAHGWPGRQLVGAQGAHAAWLLVQHADADPQFQNECLKLLETAVKKGDAEGQHLAYLTDRVLVAAGNPQRYGTQFHTQDGKLVPRPIEDPENLDARRAAVGLSAFADYERQMKRMQRPNAPAK